MRRLHLAWPLSLAFLCSVAAQAQQAGYLDLTDATTTRTRDWVLPPECDGFIHHSWGRSSMARENLRLEITELSSDKLSTGADLTASVRVTNLGKEAVVLPWGREEDIAFVKSLEGDQRYWRAGLRLQLRMTNENDFEYTLQTPAALYATPERAWTYLNLNPGEWLDFRFTGTLTCGKKGVASCPNWKPGTQVQISAQWREVEHTQTRRGCEFEQGDSRRRTLSSAALPIQFASSEK